MPEKSATWNVCTFSVQQVLHKGAIAVVNIAVWQLCLQRNDSFILALTCSSSWRHNSSDPCTEFTHSLQPPDQANQLGLWLTNTNTRLTALCPGLPRWASTRKVKPIWILLKQETVSGSGISWAVCKSAPCSRQTTMPAPHHSTWAVSSQIIGSYHKHPPSPLLLLLSP